jgi:hypothetical protein
MKKLTHWDMPIFQDSAKNESFVKQAAAILGIFLVYCLVGLLIILVKKPLGLWTELTLMDGLWLGIFTFVLMLSRDLIAKFTGIWIVGKRGHPNVYKYHLFDASNITIGVLVVGFVLLLISSE